MKNEIHYLLKAENISHNFDYPLFNNINLTLENKQTIAIIGISGSGKSTFLNIMCSLLIANNGKVLYNNQNLFDLSQQELLRIRRDDFGIIFQSHYLFRGFSANENLKVLSLLTKNKIDNQILKQLKIEHVMHQKVGELSGGQQQRLSIARVLIKKPKIIFADEPTGNLDKQTASEVIDVLFDYVHNDNKGMILVTHEKDIAYKCDSAYKLHNNKLEKLK
jgi:putative ABC transport system ATP-binding protein